MNLAIDALPASCDVLVVGAGPAGSAAAITLARAGHDVVLVDQHAFPRDKVCGDGLIPDTHAACARLGVLDEVMASAEASAHVGCIGPRGGRIDVPGRLAVLPRKELDLILCRAAVAAGARMHAPLRYVGSIEADGRVVGARLQHGDVTRELRARWVVLATGAVPQALLAAGMSDRHTPSGVALRGYVRNPAMVGRIQALEIVWHRALAPGYGWIFPCPGGVFNIGVGIADSHDARRDGKLTKREVNLRHVLDEFQRVYGPARELMQGGTVVGAFKGAPLRCSLDGARYSATRVAGHRRGRRQHLLVHRRGHRQGARDRHPGRRRPAPPAGSTSAADARGAQPTTKSRLLRAQAALRTLRARQPASTAIPGSPTC